MPPAHHHPGTQRGAYGIAVSPKPFAERLNSVSADAPRWTFTVGQDAPLPPDDTGDAVDLNTSGQRAQVTLDDDHASATLLVGTLEADRTTRTATYTPHAEVDAERLVHPTLAALGALTAHWSGQAGLHAGAVLVDGAAWAVLAARTHGKSTTLAALADAGFPVVTDDLLVIDERLQAHAGPRCIDLRRKSAHLFPAAEQVDDHPGRRARFRMALDPVPASAPLAGFITLAWDDTTGLTPIRPADRLQLIASSATLRGTVLNPRLLLDLSALPSYVLHRPQRLGTLSATLDLVASLGSRRAPA